MTFGKLLLIKFMVFIFQVDYLMHFGKSEIPFSKGVTSQTTLQKMLSLRHT